MNITPMISPVAASPRPQSNSTMSWQLDATAPCTVSTASTVVAAAGHGSTGFSGIYESKRLDPGSFAGGLT